MKAFHVLMAPRLLPHPHPHPHPYAALSRSCQLISGGKYAAHLSVSTKVGLGVGVGLGLGLGLVYSYSYAVRHCSMCCSLLLSMYSILSYSLLISTTLSLTLYFYVLHPLLLSTNLYYSFYYSLYSPYSSLLLSTTVPRAHRIEQQQAEL